jgi:hypothetical protein
VKADLVDDTLSAQCNTIVGYTMTTAISLDANYPSWEIGDANTGFGLRTKGHLQAHVRVRRNLIIT